MQVTKPDWAGQIRQLALAEDQFAAAARSPAAVRPPDSANGSWRG
ncbi:hypothetical protein ACFV6E_32705 [Streptomyces sp. NPDC059785]